MLFHCKRLVRHVAVPIAAVATLFGAGNHSHARQVQHIPESGKAISVILDSQHEVLGVVDQQTDEHMLWLRREAGNVSITSGYHWKRIVQWKTAVQPEPSSTPASEESPANEHLQTAETTAAHALKPSTPAHQRIASLEVLAEPASWDSDAQPDGLRVLLRPVDSTGRLVAVHGQVSFYLLGQRPPWRVNYQLPPRDRFVQLGRWTRQVQQGRSTPEGTVFQLEFRQFHPDRDFDVATGAILHARLSVPGIGVFEAALPQVDLRPESRLRDDLQLFTGKRYLEQ